jgi:hypothetical protein
MTMKSERKIYSIYDNIYTLLTLLPLLLKNSTWEFISSTFELAEKYRAYSIDENRNKFMQAQTNTIAAP